MSELDYDNFIRDRLISGLVCIVACVAFVIAVTNLMRGQ